MGRETMGQGHGQGQGTTGPQASAGRVFRSRPQTRALIVIALLGYAGALGSRLLGEPAIDGVVAGLLTVTGLALAAAAVQEWRWHVVVDADGLTVRPGWGRTRRVRWAQVRRLRRGSWWTPWVLEVRGGDDVGLGGWGPSVAQPVLAEVERAVRRVDPDALDADLADALVQQHRRIRRAFQVAAVVAAVLAAVTAQPWWMIAMAALVVMTLLLLREERQR